MAPVLSLGLLLGLCIGFGVLGGWLIDQWLGTSPWGAALGILWGIAAAGYQGYKVLQTSTRQFHERSRNR